MLRLLLSVRQDLLNEIEALSDTQVNLKPNKDKWSVSQVLQHLIAVDEIILPSCKRSIQKESRRVTEKSLDFVLDRTKKIQSPLPEPSTECTRKEDLLKNLHHARISLLDFINESMDSTIVRDKSIIHPLFGLMSIKQMIELIGLHEKRHIGQIKEIKEVILKY